MKNRFSYLGLIFAGTWLIVSGISGLIPGFNRLIAVDHIQVSKIGQVFLYGFYGFLLGTSVWSIVSGFGLFTRRELFRRAVVVLSYVQLCVIVFVICSGMVYHAPIFHASTEAIAKVAFFLYTVLILIFLTRPKVIQIFK